MTYPPAPPRVTMPHDDFLAAQDVRTDTPPDPQPWFDPAPPRMGWPAIRNGLGVTAGVVLIVAVMILI